MRTILGLLVLFSLAAAAALLAGNNPGQVTVYWPPYRVDLSLNLALLLLLAVIVVLYALARGLALLAALPAQARRWRVRQQERLLHQGMVDALSHQIAGRFLRARKSAEQVLAQTQALEQAEQSGLHGKRVAAMAHLLVAESSHALQDRNARDVHANQALSLTEGGRREEQEVGEGVRLRMARWAFDDNDVAVALARLDELPHGVGRRTLALRLRLKVQRLAGRPQAALETARLLVKHRAFTPAAGRGLVLGLVGELLRDCHDGAQLQQTWARLDRSEQGEPEIVLQACERMLELQGNFAQVQSWLMPVWELFVQVHSPLPSELRLRMVQLLNQGFGQTSGQPDGAWLERIELAQRANPREPLLTYLAGMACFRLNLWGKAQQLLRQVMPQLSDARLRRSAGVALAELAEQRDDGAAALEAWRQAARS